MKHLFNIDNPVFAFLGKVGDLLILNFLWLLCCVPVVTIVPATAALYYVILKIIRKEEPSLVKSFFHSFKDNLKQGILLSVIFIVLGVLLYADYCIAAAATGAFATINQIVFIILGILFLMIVSYAIPLLSQFTNSIIGTLRNAFLLSISYIFHTALILVVNFLPAIVFLVSAKNFFATLPFWMFVAPALLAFLCACLLKKIFAPLIESQSVLSADDHTGESLLMKE